MVTRPADLDALIAEHVLIRVESRDRLSARAELDERHVLLRAQLDVDNLSKVLEVATKLDDVVQPLRELRHAYCAALHTHSGRSTPSSTAATP